MPDYSIDQQGLQQFSNLEFIARQVVEGFITGLHKSPFHGFSVEFAEHRLYNTGESTKHIDWKLYGRTEKLFVKRYEEETNLRCHLILDASSSMYFPVQEKASYLTPNKASFAIYAAASLMHLLKRQRDAFGLTIFSDKIEFSSRAKSSSVHLKHLFNELEKYLPPIQVTEKKSTSVIETLHTIAEQIHRRSLVVIFSDMMDSSTNLESVFGALQHLRHNKHEVVLFHVADHQSEFEFDYDNRPYRFIDLESGREVRLQPSEVKTAYLERIHKFNQELKLKCGQYRIDIIEADIRQGFRQVLLPYLMKRSRML